ncbi:conserved hypothetical protein [Methanocella paludicola SANAE]|uniref:Uncharacterized protein n=1 Tax=Methanocella paludicola (strain DSM 17711 / JCM 13418 / NBRC 101707 / SANAE) TaxID=304371 RepID=D1YZ04_METPS|nr:hypothetical protein [Methanocella paludicola]BAI61676.1 conserved hypothetical protein [Methanocella paludicola SANAE]
MSEETNNSSFKEFIDGSALDYFQGGFDRWQVRLKRPNIGIPWYPPTDTQYFKFLRDSANIYGPDTIYNDFVKIYDITTSDLKTSTKAFSLISTISSKYNKDSLEMEIWLSVLYMAMVAEENKRWTKLGKRIKRLGVHRVLLENVPPKIAADESKGKPWKVIDEECKIRGF